MRLRSVLAGLALGLAACSPAREGTASAPATQASVHPLSGLPVVPLTISHGMQRLRFRVELARSPAQQERGLMFRKAMGADEGMIFPMQPPRFASFWMHNTVLPLDIVFIGADGRIISIAADAVPFSDAQILSGGIAGAVLELNAGRARELGIEPGDRVEW